MPIISANDAKCLKCRMNDKDTIVDRMGNHGLVAALCLVVLCIMHLHMQCFW